MQNETRIIYTKTDEAPYLATFSLFPIVEAFCSQAKVPIETRNISLAARILAQFADILPEDKKVSDDLAELGSLVKRPEANIIKLPNISASVPQIHAAVKELQSQGYPLPDYPENPKSQEEQKMKARFDIARGSAVNPVLREGNSDRRAPHAVKEYARQNPHSMGAWNPESKSHVATMDNGDFRSNEKSLTLERESQIRIEFEGTDGTQKTLKEKVVLQPGEIIDATVMSKKALIRFLHEQLEDARTRDVLFSLHLKATMMKVSDPIIFGHAVNMYFRELFDKHGATFKELNVNVRNGFGDLITKIANLSAEKRREIENDIRQVIEKGPQLAMVNSDKGITNLHVPSDVIIDASMPAMIRTSGKMWGKEGNPRDTKAVIPDSSYAGIYQATIDFCKKNGALDPATMGSVPNIGLMAQKAEEYGSHDKTFEITGEGKVSVVDQEGNTLLEHMVEAGDIWRMCQVKDGPIKDWVKLAATRARETGTPTVFWLDDKRPHDAEVIKKVNTYLQELDTSGLEIHIMAPEKATLFSLERIKEGKDTISVTGNVLRDYLTDLFPILELGTSAKMLSIVPLMNGGGLFETGAGGSAPKHVQQLLEENHLRWDSLGEFLALTVSLEHISKQTGNQQAKVLAMALDDATTKYLLNDKSPSRKVGEIDNRGSHFFLSLYWAENLALQNDDPKLKAAFTPIAKALQENKDEIMEQLNSVQGKPVNIKGYYHPDEMDVVVQMRPSKILNDIIKELKGQPAQ